MNEVIDDVIRQFADYESEDDADNNQTDNGGISWGPVDGSSLRHFNFTENNTGIKLEFYEEYINKDPYDFFKIFVTDDIIQYMVEQIAKVIQKPKGHVRAWVPTNRDEMEKFLGMILWMGLMKLPRLKAYWSVSVLYANSIKRNMPRNRFFNCLKCGILVTMKMIVPKTTGLEN